MKLTKRQREVMNEPVYDGFTKPTTVFGVDWKAAASLTKLGVLAYNPRNHQFQLADENSPKEFPYLFVISHPDYPVEIIRVAFNMAEVVDYGQRVYDQKLKPLLRAWCDERKVSMRSCYVLLEVADPPKL